MQILFYGLISETFDNSSTDSLPEANYRKFSEMEALDAHDLTVIDLQDCRLWRNKDNSTEFLNCQNDLNSIASAIEHSEHCKILIILPQNYCFRFKWAWKGGERYDYENTLMLKDMSEHISESILRCLAPFPISLTYGKSKTIIDGNFYEADFSFNSEAMPLIRTQLRSTANTITGAQLSDRVFATTLRIPTVADLPPLISALDIFDHDVDELPEWLDQISYLDEDSLREELDGIEKSLHSLETRKSEIEEILSTNKQDKAILCIKEKVLEEKAISMLAALFEIPNDFIDAKEEDFRFTTDSYIFAFEIKGCIKGLQGRHITKTLHHSQIIEDNLQEGDRRAVKGVLIVATEIDKPLSERETLPERQLGLARINNIGVMSTESLLRLYEAKREQRLDKDALVELLSSAAGEIDIDSAIRSANGTDN